MMVILMLMVWMKVPWPLGLPQSMWNGPDDRPDGDVGENDTLPDSDLRERNGVIVEILAGFGENPYRSDRYSLPDDDEKKAEDS